MFLLRLYHEADGDRPIDAHLLSQGKIEIGRDPLADWVIPDLECEVSRRHVELSCNGASLVLRPLGANGVYKGDDTERLAMGEPLELAHGDSFRFGKYRIDIDPLPFGMAATTSDATMVHQAPFDETGHIPDDWADAPEPPPFLSGDGSLLEAFCEGAKLDASVFSSEDPADVMRRAGATYRQMVLGLGDLMSERSSAKSQYRIDRTTIAAQDNNLLKWAPTQRLAIDLLIKPEAGFLSGSAAVKASFEDVKRHLLSTLAGFRASLHAVIALASPQAIDSRLGGQKSFLKNRAALCWSEYVRLHAELESQVVEDRDGPLNQAFIAAYKQRMEALEPEVGK